MSLDDFDGGVTPPDPPRVLLDYSDATQGVGRQYGVIGRDDNRDTERSYVSPRRREAGDGEASGRYQNIGGYAIDAPLVRQLSDAGIGRIYIYEYDTDDVYEFTVRQYERGREINHEGFQPQLGVPEEDAEHHWPDHGDPRVDLRNASDDGGQ